PYGVRDLGGNGLEWTGKAVSLGEPERSGRDKDFSALSGQDLVILRGRRFSADRPPRYADLETGPPPVGIGLDPEPQIGLRAVIEPQEPGWFGLMLSLDISGTADHNADLECAVGGPRRRGWSAAARRPAPAGPGGSAPARCGGPGGRADGAGTSTSGRSRSK